MALLLLPGTAFGGARSTIAPGDLAKLGFVQNLGGQLPLDAKLRDSGDRLVTFGQIFRGRPVILVLGYFHCPNLCGLVRADLIEALRKSDLEPGKDFDIAIVTIDAREKPADAAEAKAEDLARYGRPETAAAWHYLTGSEDQLRRIARIAGFNFSYDAGIEQFAHPAGLLIASPAGRVSRYMLGIDYEPRDLRLALVEASDGTIGSVADSVLLLCYGYDPKTGRYTLTVTRVMQITGVTTALLLGLGIAAAIRRPNGR
jgi:protein SCO1/2